MKLMNLMFAVILLAPGVFKTIGASEPICDELCDHQTYIENRLQSNDKRYNSVQCALRLLKQKNAKILVETGTARDGDTNFNWDGGSTIIFGNWAMDFSAILYSVDNDLDAVEQARNATLKYATNVQIVHSDSLAFIEEFNQPIDFLYLDSYDYDVKNPEPSKQHHLKEMMLAYPKLHDNSIVMIDDCDLPGGGKGEYIIQFLTERGWKIAYDGYQVVLVKDQQ